MSKAESEWDKHGSQVGGVVEERLGNDNGVWGYAIESIR